MQNVHDDVLAFCLKIGIFWTKKITSVSKVVFHLASLNTDHTIKNITFDSI